MKLAIISFVGLSVVLLSGCAGVQDMEATQLRIISLESQFQRQDAEVKSLSKRQQSLEIKVQEDQEKTEAALKANQAKLEDAQNKINSQVRKQREEKTVIKVPNAGHIQTALKNAKFYNGDVDGKIGPRTKDAIREFQRANQLNADGVVGSETWAILGKYLEEGQ
ncbi:MAG: peptidoglycan-binding domain-containing protein [Candidatus Omnitrophica bacterium]|jgi:murein L,D-transpeptidase YcbB/YkuD|nr:peptidoglycan-binding protein [Candidatus Omnitrophota bacterium]MDD5079823.1 peptidoglycan-binding domain-containing protein [Candidatus Omnitrophota bacterium]